MGAAALTVARATTTPSNLARRWLCPGSARMEKGLPDDDSSDARSGRLFHRYWAHNNYDRRFLQPQERDLLELADRLLDDVLNRLAFEMTHAFYVEQTLKGQRDGFVGTPDRVYIWLPRKSALVVDLKSGFALVERAELNLQLRGYAVLTADVERSLEHVYVALLQPRQFWPSERISLAHYELSDIEHARRQVNEIIDATEKPDAPLIAGEEQCRYCRAKFMCPAFRAALTLPVGAFRTDDEISKALREAQLEERIKRCNDEQLEKVLEACKLADQVEDFAKDEARSRIKAGGFTKFMLGKETEVRVVTNVRRAIAMLALGNVASREDILDTCELSLDKIEKGYRSRHNGMTFKQAREKINRLLQSVIAREPRKPKILRREK